MSCTNYATHAAAADLGGTKVSRRRLVITMGPGAITYNAGCLAILLAAGEAKASLVTDAAKGPRSVLVPASALQGTRFLHTEPHRDDLMLAQQIQVQPSQIMKTCLGREWFAEHPSALMRATRGLVFLRQMGPEEFGQPARQLRETAEAGEEARRCLAGAPPRSHGRWCGAPSPTRLPPKVPKGAKVGFLPELGPAVEDVTAAFPQRHAQAATRLADNRPRPAAECSLKLRERALFWSCCVA